MSSLPTVPIGIDQKLNLFLRSIKIAIENNSTVSIDETLFNDIDSRLKIIEAKSITPVISSGSGGTVTGLNVFDTTDTTTPPALTGLTASATRSFVILSWDSPSYGNQSYVTIYRSTTDDFNTAAKIGTSRYQIYSDYVPNLDTYYYWVTSTNWGGIESPVNATAGASASSITLITKSFTDGSPIGQDIGDVWYVGSEIRTWDGSQWVVKGDITSLNTSLNTANVFSALASDVAAAVTNFDNRNDRNDSAISNPVIATDGTSIDHIINTDGSSDISFEWSWAGNDNDIDGFFIGIRSSTSSTGYTFGTSPAEEIIVQVPSDRRAHGFLGIASDKYTTLLVRAFRVVDTDISPTGLILSSLVQPSLAAENPYQANANVAYAGDLIGTIGGLPIGLLANKDNVDYSIDVSNKPVELEDGRIVSALDSSGFLVSGLNSLINVSTLMDSLNGINISKNPEFLGGVTDFFLYNNSGGNAVVNNVIADDTAPNSSGYVLRYSFDGIGATSPGFGGFRQAIGYSGNGNPLRPGLYVQNSKIVYKIVAKIPVGRVIAQSSNATGTGGGFVWLTPTTGTGNWYTYIGIRTIGIGGTLSSSGHIYFNGGANTAFTVDIAKYEQTVLDASSSTFVETSFRDSNGNGLIDTAVKNDSITINSDGSLSNAGGGQVLVAQLSDSGALALKNSADYSTDITGAKPPSDATNGADYNINVANKPISLAGINPTEGDKLTNIADNADVTNYVDNRIANSGIDNSVLDVKKPAGASFSAGSNATGVIKITLPQSWSNTMMKLTLDVFLYEAGKSFSLRLSGYNYLTSTRWINTTANLSGSTASDNRVRFGHDGTKCAIYIGETGSIWQYPKILVRDFQAGFNNFSVAQWDSGWSISLENSIGTISSGADYSNTLIDANAIKNQGALATKSSVDLATTDVSNKSLANVDSTANSKLITIATGAQVNDYVDPRIANSGLDNSVLTVKKPAGGSFNGSPGTVGVIKITLPQSWSDTMMKFKVDVYLFEVGKSFSLEVSGYTYILGTRWAQTTVNLLGSTASDNRIRFGHDGTKCAIYIGETTSVWEYPKILIRDFQGSHTNFSLSQWDSGWVISVESSVGTISVGADYSNALIDANTIRNQTGFATLDKITASNITTFIDLLAVGTAQIALASIGDAQVGSLGADKIVAATLSAFTANLGIVTAGVLRSTDSNFEIDLSSKKITIAGVNGVSNDDYTIIQNGIVSSFKWNPTLLTHQAASSLNTIEKGTASNGATVSLSKYYPTQPFIIVTAHDTPIYSAANQAQDQSIQIRAENLVENPVNSGSWQFKAVSRLVLSSGSFTEVKNDVTGPVTTNVTTATYTSQANTVNVTVSVDLTSVRGTGTFGEYNNRRVTWTIYYRVSGSATSFSSVSAGNTVFGDTIDAVTDTQLVTFPSAGTWEFYIVGVFSDAGGTFTTGGAAYNYNTANVSTSGSVNYTNNVSLGASLSGTLDNPMTYTPPATWEIYGTINYGINTTYTLSKASVGSALIRERNSGGQVIAQASGGTDLLTGANVADTYTSTTWDNKVAVYYSLSSGVFTGQGASVDVTINSGSATIPIRQLITNSTAAANTIQVNDLSYTLTGGTQLNAGTVGWQSFL